MTAPTDRCGFVHADGAGNESCCYRRTWGESGRCIWHEAVGEDEAKPPEALREARAPLEIREQNDGAGPREILDGADIRDVGFPDGTDLSGVSLRGADMAEADLRHAALSGADLSDATLVDADLRGADLSGATCWEAELNDANLVNADLRGADLHESSCDDAVLREGNLHGANLEGAFFVRADLFDATLTGTLAYGAVFSEARANEGTDLDERCIYDPDSEFDLDAMRAGEATATDGGTPGDSVRVAGNGVDRMTKAEGTYKELEALCAENALLEAQGRYFVRRQDIHTAEHRREGRWSRWLRARVSRAVVLYGESPFRVLSAAAAVIVGSALLYPLGLLRSTTSGALVTYPSPTEPVAFATTLANSLYFSTLTFTTMTFGLFEPVGSGKFLTMLETGAGIILMALLVFVFGRRATR